MNQNAQRVLEEGRGIFRLDTNKSASLIEYLKSI